MTEIPKASPVMADPHLRNKAPLPSDGIVLGITRDVIILEAVELLKLRLSEILKIPPNNITCQVAINKNGVISPKIDVVGADGLEAEQVEAVVKSVWWGEMPLRQGIRDIMRERLQDLGSRRGKEEAKKEAGEAATEDA